MDDTNSLQPTIDELEECLDPNEDYYVDTNFEAEEEFDVVRSVN